MSTQETMRFICAGCGYRARIPTTYAGKVILCPGCQQMQIANADAGEATGDTVRMSKVATAQAGTGRFSVPDADGLLRFTCGGCGYGAKLAQTYAGKAISCPQCKAPQLIPPLEGPESRVGKALPPPAPQPTAGPTDDHLDLAEEVTAKPAERAPSSQVATPAAPDHADEISFDLEPAAAPASRTSGTPAAKAAPAAGPAMTPRSGSSGSAVSAKPAAKPGSGSVVRRGNRMPLPATPEPGTDDDDEDVDAPALPTRPSPAWLRKLKEPRMMAIVGSGLAALILLVVLVNGWLGASSAAADAQARAEHHESEAKASKLVLANAEFELSKARSDLMVSKKSEGELKAALAAAESRASEMGEQVKKVEADKAEEYARRKKAEADYDEMFTKFKAVEKKREDEYRLSTELRRKFEEEVKLRKDLKVRLDEAQAAAK